MIVEAVLDLVHSVALAVVGYLPASEGVPPTPEVPATSLPLSIVAGVFPWSTAIGVAGAMLGWVVVCHAYLIVLWVLGLLHITGDSGS